jgi:hypothetical protein
VNLLVCGSRHWFDYASIRDYLAAFVDRGGVSILHGAAVGADIVASRACRELGLNCYAFPPDYETFGKDAPHVRNDEMLKHADRVVAFWDGESRGTASVIRKARKLGLPIEVVR